MRAGKIRHRVSIQRKTISQNSIGEGIESWSELCKRWASIEPASGSEVVIGDQINGTVTHIVTMRYLGGLTSKDRVTFNGRNFDINGVVNTDERNIETILACREAV